MIRSLEMPAASGAHSIAASSSEAARAKNLRKLSYLAQARYLVCLGSFLALHDIELDVVTFLQAFIAVDLNCAVMYEHIGAIVPPYESISFSVVEPFDLTFILSHVRLPSSKQIAVGETNLLEIETQ